MCTRTSGVLANASGVSGEWVVSGWAEIASMESMSKRVICTFQSAMV